MRTAADMILVSVDDHIAEPADMFDGHVPDRYRDRAPRVVTDEHGYQQWWYGDLMGRNLGLNAVAGKPREMFNVNPLSYDEMRPGCFDVHERVRDMSAGGILAGLNFPNWTGFSGQVLNEGPDRALNEIMIKAYNDWHVDEWCGTYPDRFIPCGILPLFDVDKAAAEVRRLAGKGCHAVTFSENPAALKMPSIHSGHWDPLFAACSEEATVLCLHVGSSSKTASTTPDAPPSVGMSLSSVMSVYSLGDLIWADFWWRFPELTFALTEGDIGWIPYFLQRAEHVQDRHSGWTGHRFPDGMGPADVFRQRILCCFINDAVGREPPPALQPRQRLLGVGLPPLRLHVAPQSRGQRAPVCLRGCRGGRQDHPPQRHAALPLRPLRPAPQGVVHGRGVARRGARRRHDHPRRAPARRERRHLLSEARPAQGPPGGHRIAARSVPQAQPEAGGHPSGPPLRGEQVRDLGRQCVGRPRGGAVGPPHKGDVAVQARLSQPDDPEAGVATGDDARHDRRPEPLGDERQHAPHLATFDRDTGLEPRCAKGSQCRRSKVVAVTEHHHGDVAQLADADAATARQAMVGSRDDDELLDGQHLADEGGLVQGEDGQRQVDAARLELVDQVT